MKSSKLPLLDHWWQLTYHNPHIYNEKEFKNKLIVCKFHILNKMILNNKLSTGFI